ncbi:unnamed protein product [Anisakis simplex]|uniref:BZIP domain-containing protein n=1 Tax=Anisakis simplex TaxID=6269 RepID=A0A0M3J7L8_ANISI|nr:unnamed protein product [Anisakis simplex]
MCVRLKDNDSSTAAMNSKRRSAPISLSGMSSIEISERKRQQNRIAAARYRRKIRDKSKNDREEAEWLQRNIEVLKNQAKSLEDQIGRMREIIFCSVTDRSYSGAPPSSSGKISC